MHRRDLLKLSALGLALPGSLAAKSVSGARTTLKKNVVLVAVDLGLFVNGYKEGGHKCKYMNKYFKEFKGEMTYFGGLSQPGMGGGHEVQAATFTGLKYEDRNHYPDRKFISLDQHLAEYSLQTTRNKLVYHKVASGDHISWNKFMQPMPAIHGLNNLHTHLFEKTDLDKEKAAIKRERDILSALARNIRRRWKGSPQEVDLKDSLQFQLEDLEEREKWLKVKKPYTKKNFGKDAEKSPLPSCHHNYDLIFEALEKKQTQIATIQFGGGLTRNLPGITHGYHTLSHHSYYTERTSELEIIDGKVLGGLRGFVRKLKQSNMLDDTIVLFHCGMADANKHTNKNGVAFMFGGGFKHKENVKCLGSDGQVKYSTSMLFSSIIKQSGLRQTKFNGNTSLIPDIFKG